jgi:lipoprotein signal peptidase
VAPDRPLAQQRRPVRAPAPVGADLRGYLTTVALALLLGGAIGNLVDRLRYGSVVDFVDMGIGSWRFFTYNIGDAAITTAIVLLIGMALLPRLAEWGADD